MRRMPTTGGAGSHQVVIFFGICSRISFFFMLAINATCHYAGAPLIQDENNAFGKVFKDALSVAQSIFKKLLPGSSAIELIVSTILKQKSLLIESIEKMVAEHLSVEEVADIMKIFLKMDINNNGKIILEFKHGPHKLGHQIADTDVKVLMDVLY